MAGWCSLDVRAAFAPRRWVHRPYEHLEKSQFNSKARFFSNRAAMLLPRIFAPVRASIATSKAFIAPSTRVLDALRVANGPSAPAPVLSFVIHSAHQAQGRANGAKDGPGKRLGAKKSGGIHQFPDLDKGIPKINNSDQANM